MSDIRTRAQAIVCDLLDITEDMVTNEASFKDDLGADSLDVVEVIMKFENEFDINISDEAAEKVITFGDAVKCIEDYVS